MDAKMSGRKCATKLFGYGKMRDEKSRDGKMHTRKNADEKMFDKKMPHEKQDLIILFSYANKHPGGCHPYLRNVSAFSVNFHLNR